MILEKFLHSKGYLFALSAAAVVFSGSTHAATCTDFRAAKTKWESDMTSYGAIVATSLSSLTATQDNKLANIYYDGQWVYLQIAEYTGQSIPWKANAEIARLIYMTYLTPANFAAQGYRRFPHGFYYDYKAGGLTTLATVTAMRDKPNFSRLAEYVGVYAGNAQSISRELAYALQANIYAEKAGLTRKLENGKAVPEQLVTWSAEHFKQWKSGQFLQSDINAGNIRFAPFMAGLLSHALIEYIEWEEQNGRDPNKAWPTTSGGSIEATLVDFFEWMRDSAKMRGGAKVGQPLWVANAAPGLGTFYYQDMPDANSTVDTLGWELGTIVGYPYAWLANRMKNGTDEQKAKAQKFMEIADELFIGTAQKSWLQGGGKFFNQSYRLGIPYMKINQAAGLGLCAAAVVKPNSPSNVIVQ